MDILRILVYCAAGTTIALAQSAPNVLTPKEVSDGWTLLFDGKSLTGWQARATSVRTATGDWTVENGVIM